MSQLIFEVLIQALLASQLLFHAFLLALFGVDHHNQQIQPAEFATPRPFLVAFFPEPRFQYIVAQAASLGRRSEPVVPPTPRQKGAWQSTRDKSEGNGAEISAMREKTAARINITLPTNRELDPAFDNEAASKTHRLQPQSCSPSYKK